MMKKKMLIGAAIGLIGLLILFIGVFTAPKSERRFFDPWFATSEVKSADATAKADQLGAGERTASGNKVTIRVNVRKSTK